jgi:hypothetical protein
MVNLRGPLMSSALALLTVHPNGAASGAWGFFAQTCLADAAFRLVTADDDETSLGTEIVTPDHSWALIWHDPCDGCYPTSQAGPRRLVDLLERAYHQWSALNKPRWDAFGITVTPTGQWVYYGQPDNTYTRWDLGEWGKP